MKPRSDSKLKTLSDEQKAQIAEWLRTPKSDTCVGGQKHALAMIKSEFGITTSKPALTAFLAYWELEEDFSQADIVAKFAEESMLKFDPTDRHKAEQYGQYVFENLAIRHKDPQSFVALQRLALDKESAKFKGRLEEEKLKLSREKFEVSTCETFLKWYGVRKARSIAESNLSNADKIAKLRAEFFRDVDALEASGEVQLPE